VQNAQFSPRNNASPEYRSGNPQFNTHHHRPEKWHPQHHRNTEAHLCSHL